MTKKKDLKKRVRARQDETGQRYTEALKDVLATGQKLETPRPLSSKVVEYSDASEQAQRIGLRCRVFIHPALWKGAEASEALTELALRRIHQIAQLDAALGMRSFRRVALEGQLFDLDNRDMGAMLDFYRSTCAGLRGPSLDGARLAFDVELPDGQTRTLVADVVMTSTKYREDKRPAMTLGAWDQRVGEKTLEAFAKLGAPSR